MVPGPGSRHQPGSSPPYRGFASPNSPGAWNRKGACRTARAVIIWYFRTGFDSEVRGQRFTAGACGLHDGDAMPSLLRLLTIIGLLGAVVYGGLYALAHFVQPKPREISVSIPPDKFFKEH
jgi:hypothetical protein